MRRLEPFARIRRHPLSLVPLALASWALTAYVALPLAWTTYERQRGLEGLEMVTRTAQGIPGDPLNVGLVGSADEVMHALDRAGWDKADPVTLVSSLKIVDSVLLQRPYPNAPVSPLFYRGSKEALAYQQQVGVSAKQRHHVRFWKLLEKGQEGRAVWLGSVTFDKGVGFSHYTGQITHHIDADVDAERDRFGDMLAKAGVAEAVYRVTGVGPTLSGRNGGGDPYHTDGDLEISILVAVGETRKGPLKELEDPPLVQLKNIIFDSIAPD